MLEIACGSGRLCHALKGGGMIAPEVSYIASDYTEAFLERARERLKDTPGVTVQRENAMALTGKGGCHAVFVFLPVSTRQCIWRHRAYHLHLCFSISACCMSSGDQQR